jgi:hypothetical protein
MIFRILTVAASAVLFTSSAWAQQGAVAPIPPPDAAASMSQINPTAGPIAGPPAPAMKAGHRREMAHGLNARERRETRALNWLEATGNRDFSDVQRDGRNYRATVTNDGTQQIVIVNPDTGQITPVN